jgi:GTPase
LYGTPKTRYIDVDCEIDYIVYRLYGIRYNGLLIGGIVTYTYIPDADAVFLPQVKDGAYKFDKLLKTKKYFLSNIINMHSNMCY